MTATYDAERSAIGAYIGVTPSRDERILSMIDGDRHLSVGTGSRLVRISLTQTAARMLDELPGSHSGAVLGDHRSLLTTIVVGRAAAGRLDGDVLLINGHDIIEAIEHTAPNLMPRAVRPPQVRS